MAAIQLRSTRTDALALTSTQLVQTEPLTVKEYCLNRMLPEEDLTEAFQITDAKDKDRLSYVKTPVVTEDGKTAGYIKLYKNDQEYSAGAVNNALYGEWLLPSIRLQHEVIITRDVTSAQALLLAGRPALGVIGKFRVEWGRKLAGLTVYIYDTDQVWVEQIKTALRVNGVDEDGRPAELKRLALTKTGSKDPANLWTSMKRAGQEGGFDKTIETLMRSAPDIDLVDGTGHQVTGIPIPVKIPAGYDMTDDGIYAEIHGELEQFSGQPVIIRRQLKLDLSGDRLIELQWREGDKWESVIKPASTVKFTQGMQSLADAGLDVSSITAARMVDFLQKLIRENKEIIPVATATRTLGWKAEGKVFLPYDEGEQDDVVLDVGGENMLRARAMIPHGSYTEWREIMRPNLSDDRFRFVMASSFATPLLYMVEERNFVVYCWGDSESGKTAQNYAALSIWGNPDQMTITFGATAVGLERTAEFFNCVPFTLDEQESGKQQGDHQNKIDPVQAIYDLANGKGKQRSTRDGKTDYLAHWKTAILATGERMFTRKNTSDGNANRMIVIHNGAFEGHAEDAKVIYQMGTWGHAGPIWIDALKKSDWEKIRELIVKMSDEVETKTKGQLSHGKLAIIAIVAVADYLSQRWIWSEMDRPGVINEDQIDWERSLEMAMFAAEQQILASDGSTNERAVKYLVDWIQQNSARFRKYTFVEIQKVKDIENTVGEEELKRCRELDERILNKAGEWPISTQGFLEQSGDRSDLVLVIPSVMRAALDAEGFDWAKTTTFMKEMKILQFEKNRTDKKVRVDCNGTRERRIVVDLERIRELEEQKEKEKNKNANNKN